MIFHENRLLADDSHVISYLIFVENRGKMLQNLSSAAVVSGDLRVRDCSRLSCWIKKHEMQICIHVKEKTQTVFAYIEINVTCSGVFIFGIFSA